MLALNKAKRNFTVSLVTSIGLVALLLYYILAYLPHNQQRLEARNFRVLSRIGDNLHHSIQASVTGLNKMAKGSAKKSDQDTINQAFLKELYKLVKEHQHETAKESLKTSGAVHLYRNIYDDYVHASSHSSGSESSHRGSTNSYELHFKVANYHYAKSISQLIAPLLRDDVFQEFYIFKDPGADLNTAALKADHIIYSTSLIGINFFKPAATQDGPLKGTAGNVLDFDLAGQAYKLFVVKQEIGYGQKWILCGAIPTSEYNRQRMAIPNDTIGYVVLGLVLLVLSLPFIKLALLGEKERIGMGSIGLCFLSLFFGASILLLLWLNATTYWGRDNDIRKTQLETLATDIESSVKEEIRMILDQMAVFDQEIIDSNRPIFFQGNVDSIVWKASTYQANNVKATPYYTNYYPFFMRLSWIDNLGNQLRTYSKNGKRSPLINVKTRPYFRKIIEGDTWKLKDREEEFYLNGVTSWLDGENYVIISQKSAGKFADAVCITMTTKLVSLTQAILPRTLVF